MMAPPFSWLARVKGGGPNRWLRQWASRGRLSALARQCLPVLTGQACLPALVCGVLLGVGGTGAAWAGAQQEEALADSVRTALSAAIGRAAPPAPVFADQGQQKQFDLWVQTSENRLLKKKPQELVRREFLQTVWYEAKRAGLDPGLVMGLIEVESGFRKYAISSVGARGYMQVMPFWTRQIGDGNASALFHMQTNLRFGCVILRHYLNTERGNLFMALGRYNGSRGRAEYPNAVMAAWRRWKMPDAGVQFAQYKPEGSRP